MIKLTILSAALAFSLTACGGGDEYFVTPAEPDTVIVTTPIPKPGVGPDKEEQPDPADTALPNHGKSCDNEGAGTPVHCG